MQPFREHRNTSGARDSGLAVSTALCDRYIVYSYITVRVWVTVMLRRREVARVLLLSLRRAKTRGFANRVTGRTSRKRASAHFVGRRNNGFKTKIACPMTNKLLYSKGPQTSSARSSTRTSRSSRTSSKVGAKVAVAAAKVAAKAKRRMTLRALAKVLKMSMVGARWQRRWQRWWQRCSPTQARCSKPQRTR